MIGYLSYMETQKQNQVLLGEVRKKAGSLTDEKWEYHLFESVDEAVALLEKNPMIHMIAWDIIDSDSTKKLEKVRRNHKEPLLMVIANERMSPLVYLKPSISPDALLLKPVTRNRLVTVLDEMFEEFESRFQNGKDERIFTAERRDGKIIIPLHQIDYFEAREKKIFVCARNIEEGFYSTFEEVEEKLPENFIRCHRSFIVNIRQAREIDFVHNMICLKDGVEIPFSRSYKKKLKEYGNGR